jgi:hypothetical protein
MNRGLFGLTVLKAGKSRSMVLASGEDLMQLHLRMGEVTGNLSECKREKTQEAGPML